MTMELKGTTIFILGTAKFDEPYESTSYTLAKYLARDNQVFYVDYPFTWKDYLKNRDGAQFARRKGHFSPLADGIIDTDVPNLKVVIVPPVASINFLPEGWWYRRILRLNQVLIIRRLQHILRRYGIKEYIYLNSFSFNYPDVAYALRPAPALTIYQSVDPLIIEYDKRHGQVSEPWLVRHSDLCICTSKALYEQYRAVNPKTFFIPNAANLHHSSKALDPALEVHPALQSLTRPVIGYFGNIERRIDYVLLERVFRDHPDKTFVFAGALSEDWPAPDWFFQVPNVVLLGRQPYDQMPAIVKGFDVAIIPFKEDHVSRTIFPLKLFEYLGAGRPTVSTNFNPDLAEHAEGTVFFCKDPETFSAAINQALRDNGPDALAARLAVAGRNTWENRVEELMQLAGAYIRRS
ncbi:glycosyltransferase [Dinghuibacter silviterrae]|uniref:Glycosyltransferase involved in cell wall biosynthesis n=1 Tax=Dinghuibacter silviterrae TaxID=1539049 RepID=A0A4R8DV84_9BACT|nr:glycosyltransferase [Dinghuibacter silviterrae]TDX01916.1 glycosyltransferase involved in cell wall biosynthesis [Dinghuibacter silviterrae]